LVTGKGGQLGWELERALAPLGDVRAVDRETLDLSDPDSIRHYVRGSRPTIILNAAAYTAVDRAESEVEQARRINALAPAVLAEEAKRLGAWLVHYSTEYVFDGESAAAYVETDTPRPLNVYGQTKLEGEQAVQVSGAPHLIFRTSWLYGARGHNFMRTILRLRTERSELRIVDDQIGAPTWVRWVAEATAQVLTVLRQQRREPEGLYHLTCGGSTSWYGFAKAIVERVPAISAPETKLTPIPTTEYPLPARRPKNSRLSNERLRQDFGITLPSWESGLELCLADYLSK
jgi:dTDP-4-dehydrorhamnose reductase